MTDLFRLVLLNGLAGLPAGLLWWVLAPRVDLVVSSHSVDFVAAEPTGFMNADAWFFLVCAVFGAGATLLLAIRRRHSSGLGGLGALVGLLAGGFAGAAIAALFGSLLGHADPLAAAAHLADGVHLQAALRLRSTVAMIGWPIGALIGWVAVELRPVLRELSTPQASDQAAS